MAILGDICVAHAIGFLRRDIVKDVEQISAADKRREKKAKEKAKEEKLKQKEMA